MLTHSQQLLAHEKGSLPTNTLSQSQTFATPYKYLLNHELYATHTLAQRSPEEIRIVTELLSQNQLLIQLQLTPLALHEISNDLLLVYSQNPHIIETHSDEIHLILEGQGFEYMQQTKGEAEEYVMMRKISANGYFVPLNGASKYQFMVDESSLVGKISGECFAKHIHPKLFEQQRSTTQFLQHLKIFAAVTLPILLELTRFLLKVIYEPGQTLVKEGSANKHIFFVKSGKVEITHQDGQQHTIKDYQIFGIQSADLEKMEWAAVSLERTEIYSVEKRLLAIVMAAWTELNQKQAYWSWIDINRQIKGQSHCSEERELLSKNVERIRTSEQKARNFKLKFMTTKRSSHLIETPKQYPATKRTPQRPKKTAQPRQSELRSQSETGWRPTSNWQLKSDETEDRNNCMKVSNIEMKPYEERQMKMTPITRNTTAKQFAYRISHHSEQKTSTSLGVRVTRQTTHKLSPNFSSVKMERDLLDSYLFKKLKSDLLARSEEVVSANKRNRLREMKSLRRIFHKPQKRKPAGAECTGDELFERMAHITDNPLLFRIESERRKMERQDKLLLNKAKARRPVRKEQNELILIRNMQ